MRQDLPLFPPAASTGAHQVDAITYVWLVVAAFFSLLIAGLILYFMSRYRRRSEDAVGAPTEGHLVLEIIWTAIPLALTLGMFAWGAKVFFFIYRPPSNAVEYFAVGKQWMWKFQHPEGNREINQLHVPLGQPIKMIMTSEDVIHSFYVPAFRMKQDVLPGRYTTTWFKADRAGTFHLFCAEYCGTEHSRMIGSVVVMEPTDYEAWLSGAQPGQSIVASGAQLFESLACNTCHRPGPGMAARGPRLEGLFGRQVVFADGRSLIANEDYIRESIVAPAAKVVAGYQPIMPTFQGQVTEEQLVQLVAYVKSLAGTPGEGTPAAAEGATRAGTPAVAPSATAPTTTPTHPAVHSGAPQGR
jgi:cytochrome c oxidase subunit 2